MASTAFMLTKELVEIAPHKITCLSTVVGVGVNANLASKLTIQWMWRVDLHHHRQVYETCAPLLVLRHRRWKTP
jgi:hypothetical protein